MDIVLRGIGSSGNESGGGGTEAVVESRVDWLRLGRSSYEWGRRNA